MQLPAMLKKRLEDECAKLDPEEEVALAEEGLSVDRERRFVY